MSEPPAEPGPSVTRPRGNARDRGVRYLGEGRVVITAVRPRYVRAVVRGSGAVWRCGYARGAWFCDCPARTTCAHVWALMLVTAPVTLASNDGDWQQDAAAR